MEIEPQLLLFTEVGWQECITHEGYDPHAYYDEWEIERMMIELGYIDCPLCLIEIGGSG